MPAGFTSECDCPDDAAPYEPCECCGTPIAHYGLDYSWVEDDMQREHGYYLSEALESGIQGTVDTLIVRAAKRSAVFLRNAYPVHDDNQDGTQKGSTHEGQ